MPRGHGERISRARPATSAERCRLRDSRPCCSVEVPAPVEGVRRDSGPRDEGPCGEHGARSAACATRRDGPVGRTPAGVIAVTMRGKRLGRITRATAMEGAATPAGDHATSTLGHQPNGIARCPKSVVRSVVRSPASSMGATGPATPHSTAPSPGADVPMRTQPRLLSGSEHARWVVSRPTRSSASTPSLLRRSAEEEPEI
jgi:hypothetical protein